MSHATSEMTFNLDQLFTHKDILQSRETNLFQQEKGEELTFSEQMRIIESEGGAAYSHCPHALPLIKKGDFISILNCAWKKNYAEDISFKNVHDPKNGVGDLLLYPKYIQSKIGELEEQIIAGPWNCSGRGRTKKLAQHRAAANVLLKIIEDGRHKEFLIPGQNEEEAREIIMNAMEEQKIINSAPPQVQGTQSISSSESSSTMTTAPPSGQQTNWIGKLNELIQIKKIRCHWSDHVDQRNGPLNVVEHCHKTILVIEDSEKKFEGNGNGKNKKLAKQLAHKEIYEQLCQIYEINNQMESATMKQSTSSTMAAENNLVKNEEQIEQNEVHQNIPIKTNQPSIPPSIECIQTTNIVEEAKIQIENIDENVENGQGTDIRPYLEEIFTNRNKHHPEMILRQIFAWKDARIVKAFPQAELKFIETKRNPLFDVQIYLEIWAGHGSKRILNCTFGGEGIDIKAAKNDAIWQAIEFIYYFVDISSHLNE